MATVSLQRGGNRLSQWKNRKNPSPIRMKMLPVSESARNPNQFFFRAGKVPPPFASLFAEVKAGMTVEAAVVLPLFLFFFMNLASFLEMMRLHGNLELAVWKTGSELAVYGYALDSGNFPEEEKADGGWQEERQESGEQQEESWWKRLSGAVFSSVFVKAQMIEQLGREYLDASPLQNGADSLMFWESEVFGAGDTIDLVVTYSVKPWNSLPVFFPFRMANRCYVHIWNGYEIPGRTQAGEMVFVTETGQVYHRDRNCTHLMLSVRQIGAGELGGARNDYGRRYTACEKCVDGRGRNILYVTGEGDRYHYRRDCPGLKRTVSAVLKTDAEKKYRPCSRCSPTGER